MINKGSMAAALNLLALTSALSPGGIDDILDRAIEREPIEPPHPKGAVLKMITQIDPPSGLGTGICHCGKIISLNKRACRSHSLPEELEKR